MMLLRIHVRHVCCYMPMQPMPIKVSGDKTMHQLLVLHLQCGRTWMLCSFEL